MTYQARWPYTSEYHRSIPIALYTATAQLQQADGNTRPLKIAQGFGLIGTAWGDSVPVEVLGENKIDLAISE